MIFGLLVTVPDEFQSLWESWEGLAYGVILPIIFGVLAFVFLILGIMRAVGIASAENEDTKKKAVKSMIIFLVGFVSCFIIAVAVPLLFNYLSGIFSIPTGA